MTQQIPMSFRRTTSDLSSPVDDSSPTHYHNTSNTDNMVRSSSAEPAKTTKRKGMSIDLCSLLLVSKATRDNDH